jgi:lipopolysaccharide/colanic/teichoic acid biosynthesis glycosyltransferase
MNKKTIMYLIIKRIFDFSSSLLGLIILIPVFLPIMIILKFTGEGEVFYLQKRMGKDNSFFYIYKFATMLKDSPNIGTGNHTVRNDPRVTEFGKILRITKINELPQILNVLFGSMSLVGPRPLIEKSFYKYSKEVQDIIYKNKPGITGLGSLVFRDEEKLVSAFSDAGGDTFEYYSKYIFPYKGQLESWYRNNISFIVDLKILFLTFWSLVDSKSNLVQSWLKDIPQKPEMLTIEGILKNKKYE